MLFNVYKDLGHGSIVLSTSLSFLILNFNDNNYASVFALEYYSYFVTSANQLGNCCHA